mmetsp:Transcript_30867/g.89844  ORF Transcript_30867/g.89844 Transcript_30867/m.89844 type:complete len:412 (+) Transcript_30867:91-1326(+)
MKWTANLMLATLLFAGYASAAVTGSLQTHARAAQPIKVDHMKGIIAHKAKEKPGAWTSTQPDSTDYNPETSIDGWPFTIEKFFAMLYCFMLASTPLLLAILADRRLTRAHMLESVTLIAWLGSVIYLFTNVLKFQAAHWDGFRPLTLVEAVYLLSQIITTVGYGDITPAFPRGQVWVGFNVILALCLYGSIVCEVIGMVQDRLARVLAGQAEAGRSRGQPLKDWYAELSVDLKPLVKSALSFTGVATVGVLFWHYYPGEGKSWLQAVYMSVITLSTVGFGAFTAVTEGGKVFGAFWMLCGVASLGALISVFIETMLHVKFAERRRQADVAGEFADIMRQAGAGEVGDVQTSGKADETMDKAQFLKFGLMLTTKIDPAAFRKIESRFEALVGDDKVRMVRRTKLVEVEGPSL